MAGKPNAKQSWEAWVKCSEGGWKSGGGREKVVSAARLPASQISTDSEVSSETQMCEKERVSEGESHT